MWREIYSKILQIIPILILGWISVVFFKSNISGLRFLLVAIVWIALFALTFVSNRIELIKIIIDSLTAVIAVLALLLSIFNLTLQQTPTLLLKNFELRQKENRVYLYVQNKGSIGAWYIKGAYLLALTQEPGEPGSGITANERSLAFDTFEEEGAFYPENITVISPKLKLEESLLEAKKNGAVYFFIHIEYPRFQFGKFKIGGKWGKGYDEAFYLNDEMQWVIMPKNHLPRFFKIVFSSLKKGAEPKLPLPT